MPLDPTGERRLRRIYPLVAVALAAGLVAAWDPADWHPVALIALLGATALVLDATGRRFDDSDGIRYTTGAMMPVVLLAVLVGPVPAAVVAGVSGLSDSILLGSRFVSHLRNALGWMAAALLVGLASERWTPPHADLGAVAVVFLLYCAAEALDSISCIVHGEVLRVSPWRDGLGATLFAAPANLVAALIVAAAVYGYRAGGAGVLAVMSAGIVVCQLLMLRIERVEGTLRAERDRHAGYLRMVGTMVVTLDAAGRVTFLNARARDALGAVEGRAGRRSTRAGASSTGPRRSSPTAPSSCRART
jgi:hypothetical protein